MRTHTIRKTKGGLRIVTFTKPFMKKLLESEEYAVRLLLQKMIMALGDITGKVHKINYDQLILLNNALPYVKNEDSAQIHFIKQCFEKGFFPCSLEVEKVLDAFNCFAKMVKQQ